MITIPQLYLDNYTPPKLPEEYMGKLIKKSKYVKSQPRKWTDEEITLLKELVHKKYTTKQIAEILHRSIPSVSLKRKRLTKDTLKNNTYNSTHKKEKQEINNLFINYIKPSKVLDVYNGGNTQYSTFNCTTNDINKEINSDYHCEAYDFMIYQYLKKNKYDFIDIDPFGSGYDCFDIAFKLLNTKYDGKGCGLCITFGEFGHKRFKRLDYVKRYYGINTIEEFTSDKFLKELNKIALRNKCRFEIFKIKEWRNICRVWLKVFKIKITEQWE